MLDIEQALSSSLDRDGKGAMRAPLQMGGNKISGIEPGTLPNDAATVSQLNNTVSSIPIGSILDYWGATPPEGWLFAAGQEISRATYSALFDVIGTVAGAGNGSTTFNLPDYRGRIGAGRESMATPATTRLNTFNSSTMGAVGGGQTHTLTINQLPAHTHPVTDPGHAHSATVPNGSQSAGDGFGPQIPSYYGGTTTGSAVTGLTIGNAGSSEPHNNIQPTIICNKIIRVS